MNSKYKPKISDEISFVIPAYNCEKTIAESIYSIINGNYETKDEIIIVNDGSNDRTLKIVKNLQKKFPFIIIVNNLENKGCPASRNIGISCAKNKLIFNLDSDDVLVPGSVSKLKKYLISNKADVAAFGESHFFIDSIKNVTHKRIYNRGLFTLADFLAGLIIPGGNFIYTKSSWEKIGGYWEYGRGLHEQWGFELKQIASGSKFIIMPNSYYYHRYGYNSLYVRESKDKCQSSLMATKMIKPFLHLLYPQDADYIKSDYGSKHWFIYLAHNPIRLKSNKVGKTGKVEYTKVSKNQLKIKIKLILKLPIIFYRQLRFFINNLYVDIKNKRKEFKNIALTTSLERKLSTELRNKIKHLPSLQFGKSEADNAWISYRNKLRSYILQKNLQSFLQWDIIKQTMFVENPQFIEKELNYLKSALFWNRYKKILTEISVGSPILYNKYLKSSGNLIHQMYHISQFEVKTGVRIDKLKLIVDFGGGYGKMCSLIHNLGFKGKYIIFDMDEFSALQEYYLKSLELNVIDINNNPYFKTGIACISDLSLLKFILKNNNSSKCLFLATWSISETSVEFRKKFFKNLPAFKNYLIAYRNKFREVDNIEFFSSFVKKRRKHYWQTWEIPHLKENFYLIGSKTKNVI